MHSAVSVLLLLVAITIAASQLNGSWGENDVGCIEGFVPYADQSLPLHLQWARFLHDKVHTGLGNTTYAHTAGPIYWGPYSCNDLYTSVSDCNGFTSAILKQAYDLVVPSPAGYDHAYASTYWHYIVDEQYGFTHITNVQDIQPGDLIAFNYLYGLNDTQYLGTKNSGHIALVNSAPVIVTPMLPFIDDTIQWSVNVIDQTSDPHWITDNRYNVSVGLGSGNFRLYTSASNGSWVGYSWSFSPVTLYYQNNVIRSPAAGRLTGITQPGSTCGITISQVLYTSWVAETSYTQWIVSVRTSFKPVDSLTVMIDIPPNSFFSSWQIQPVPGATGTFTLMDWHFSANPKLPLPTNYEFQFGYTANSATRLPLYISSHSC